MDYAGRDLDKSFLFKGWIAPLPHESNPYLQSEMKGMLVKSASVHAGGTVHFYSD